jgi:nitrite reductase/ring-hydroxylating ferredoxin subunit
MAEEPVPVCATADLPPGSVKSFEVGDELVAVYNIDGTFYATEARCTHATADLADGILEGDVIECSLHFGAFHVPSGKARCRRPASPTSRPSAPSCGTVRYSSISRPRPERPPELAPPLPAPPGAAA